jgi:hypothetical protein|tara:strand:- start:409 stop:741 length:333 start_codon:yes stop_codon:yes gene_type:complete
MVKYVEIRKGDIIIFNSKSGSGSFVYLRNKGNYFMPAKRELRLDGQKLPIKLNEPFVYLGSEVLETKGATRMVRISLTRLKTNQACIVNEYHLHKYFSKPENHLPYVENY